MTVKQRLYNYLKQNGKNKPLVDIYNDYPYRGYDLTYKQKADAVRTVFRKIEREIKDLKILIFDTETTPLQAWVWNIWKQNVNPLNGQLQSEVMLLSWSAKWLYSEAIMSDVLEPEEVLAEDDSRIAKSLWNILNEADIVIAHNGIGFDVKIANTRFIKNGLHPPSHYQVIDTLLHARKAFRLESNKLDYLGKFFNLGKKDKTDFNLWLRCMKGERTALNTMRTYCNQDVKLLEAIYLKMRPYIKPHPNVNLMVDHDKRTCPVCNSNKVQENGKYTTYANVYKAYYCKSCGSTFRSKSSDKIDKSNLHIVTPK